MKNASAAKFVSGAGARLFLSMMKRKKRNAVIYEAVKKADKRLWEVAELMGLRDFELSKRLRRELPDEEKIEILNIIQSLAAKDDEE